MCFWLRSQRPESRRKRRCLRSFSRARIYHLAGESGEWTYRLGGPTCLAGDVVGDFSFPRELTVGDTLVFDDMAHYTMVKTTIFNGVKHPAIALQHEDGEIEVIREFTYEDFRDRLA